MAKNASTTPPVLTDATPFTLGRTRSSHRGEYATLEQYPTPTAVHLTSYGSVKRGRGYSVRAQIGESGQYLLISAASARVMRDAGVRTMGDIIGMWSIGPNADKTALVVLGRAGRGEKAAKK